MDSAQIAALFYEAMKTRDTATMNKLYGSEATFSDSVFPSLNSKQTQAMWEMLLKGAKNFSVEYKVTNSGPDFAEVDWVASYNFSKTGRPVVNHINTRMEFKNQKIIAQKDSFDLYAWSKQAMGLPGYLLGWTPFMRNKIQSTANANLVKYIGNKG